MPVPAFLDLCFYYPAVHHVCEPAIRNGGGSANKDVVHPNRKGVRLSVASALADVRGVEEAEVSIRAGGYDALPGEAEALRRLARDLVHRLPFRAHSAQ